MYLALQCNHTPALQCIHTHFFASKLTYRTTNMSVIQKMLLENIDQEIEVILMKQKQYDLDSFVRGYHA